MLTRRIVFCVHVRPLALRVMTDLPASRRLCKSASSGIIFLKSFLWVAHDHNGEPVGGPGSSISRGFMWSVAIAADPDYGISFDKKWRLYLVGQERL